MANSIVNTAMQFLGVPYVWGGTSPSGFDCSGLVQYSYAQNGVDIPRVAQDQYNASTKISRDQLQAGDLVFGGTSTNNITHVMMYIGDGKVVHAPRTGEVVKVIDLDSYANVVGYGTYGSATNTGDINTQTTALSVKADGILSKIVQFLIILVVAFIAVVFFMKAFEIKIF